MCFHRATGCRTCACRSRVSDFLAPRSRAGGCIGSHDRDHGATGEYPQQGRARAAASWAGSKLDVDCRRGCNMPHACRATRQAHSQRGNTSISQIPRLTPQEVAAEDRAYEDALCRQEYGEASFWGAPKDGYDRCLCKEGYSFRGQNCQPTKEQTGPTRWGQHSSVHDASIPRGSADSALVPASGCPSSAPLTRVYISHTCV